MRLGGIAFDPLHGKLAHHYAEPRWPAGILHHNRHKPRAKLRHFCASWCINRKVDGGLELQPKVVRERLGHSSIAMTMDVYGHLFPAPMMGSSWRPRRRISSSSDATRLQHGGNSANDFNGRIPIGTKAAQIQRTEIHHRPISRQRIIPTQRRGDCLGLPVQQIFLSARCHDGRRPRLGEAWRRELKEFLQPRAPSYRGGRSRAKNGCGSSLRRAVIVSGQKSRLKLAESVCHHHP